LSAAGESVAARCVHFGACGGCQLQNVAYDLQLRRKRATLVEALEHAGVLDVPEVAVHAGEPWGYRNRVRLRLRRVGEELRVGYNVAGRAEFLPVTMCPIAAPALWETAQALLALAARAPDAAAWLDAAEEVDLFCDDAMQKIQLTLLCVKKNALRAESLAKLMALPRVAGAAAVLVDRHTKLPLRTLAETGAGGLAYRVGEETYWIPRGGFFQVNRFLVDQLVRLVCEGRSGTLAWDLFAGVGLFSRVLARSFAALTAVEANAIAVGEARSALARIAPQHAAVRATTVAFLRAALVQRERPDLIVLDPPRAGAGAEACELLLRFAPKTIVYVSCDPGTLARDLALLQSAYRPLRVEMVDMFPQTLHVETVVVLERKS
jgi:23S rRNA (uracil1939-C5)-methyltransferase